MDSWIYENRQIKKIDDFGNSNVYGFIYKITNKETGKFYIGKKNLIFSRNKKLGKKELKLIREERKAKKIQGKLPTKKLVITESDWLDYYGSSKELIQEVEEKGKDNYKREILQLAYNSKQLTYFETLYQMKEDVLRKDTYNNSILGKFHRKDFEIKK
jgi:hypothetical protein